MVLDVLKQSDPVTFATADGKSYALADSIPRKVLDAFETLTPSIQYVKARDAWCLTAGDWFSFRERLIVKLMKRMAIRSLELAITGPSPDDLAHAPVLEPWIAIRDPQCGGAILIGKQAGHPTVQVPLISTSRLCGIDAERTWARTASRWYKLGDPISADSLFEGLGPKAARLVHLALEFWQVQALVAEDQMYEGLRD
jgi:hypothetical protein